MHGDILSEELREAVLRAIRRGAPADVAAAVCGVSLRSWYRWREKGRAGEEPYAALEALIDQAEAEQELGYVSRVRRDGKGDWRSSAWLLERSKPDRWGVKRGAEDHGEGEPVPSDLWDE